MAPEPPPIRLAGAGDWNATAELLWQLNVFERSLSGDRLTDRRAAVRSLASVRRLTRRTHGQMLVAGAPGAVVGVAAWGEAREQPFVVPHLRRFAQVFDLVVAEGQRGQGIGTALLGAIETEARARGLRRMGIGFLAGNDRAQRTYQHFGFDIYAIEMSKRF